MDSSLNYTCLIILLLYIQFFFGTNRAPNFSKNTTEFFSALGFPTSRICNGIFLKQRKVARLACRIGATAHTAALVLSFESGRGNRDGGWERAVRETLRKQDERPSKSGMENQRFSRSSECLMTECRCRWVWVPRVRETISVIVWVRARTNGGRRTEDLSPGIWEEAGYSTSRDIGQTAGRGTGRMRMMGECPLGTWRVPSTTPWVHSCGGFAHMADGQVGTSAWITYRAYGMAGSWLEDDSLRANWRDEDECSVHGNFALDKFESLRAPSNIGMLYIISDIIERAIILSPYNGKMWIALENVKWKLS